MFGGHVIGRPSNRRPARSAGKNSRDATAEIDAALTKEIGVQMPPFSHLEPTKRFQPRFQNSNHPTPPQRPQQPDGYQRTRWHARLAFKLRITIRRRGRG